MLLSKTITETAKPISAAKDNWCNVDGSKTITNIIRMIISDTVKPPSPQ
jgi:hypothetical protein